MSATPKQRDMIEKLLVEKGCSPETITITRTLMDKPDAQPRTHISPVIDELMALPRPARPNAPAGDPDMPGVGPVNKLLRSLDIRVSSYAIPTEELPAGLVRYASGNSHLHVEVNEFKDTRYVRVLHGAPGSFNRSKLESYLHATLLADTLRPPLNQLRYSQIFGETYSCCGVCHAELTDDTSKALKLGPVCRKRFGL